MAETSDYDPGAWKGHDFKDNYKAYDAHAGRAYDSARKDNKSAKDMVPATVKTDSESPVVIVCDGTGSMGDWPKTIFAKLPYLDIEGQEYLGKTMEISFAVVGDGYSDKYPLQVQPFAKGTELKDVLAKLFPESGGGATGEESYELAALYYARNCEIPKATLPIFIFIGDEAVYDAVDKTQGETWARATVEGRLTTHKVIGELKQKFNVYIIRKPYNCSGNDLSSEEVRNRRQWEKLLGEDHVLSLPDPNRVVDVIFGIFAKETGREDYFEDELKQRQLPDKDGAAKVSVVLSSLATIHKLDGAKSLKKLPGPKGASITHKSDSAKSKKSISLMDT
jgi:hypothetical protein